jgi:hypothetical protein
MKVHYIDCNEITKHVVLHDVMEHAVNKILKNTKKNTHARTNTHQCLDLGLLCSGMDIDSSSLPGRISWVENTV